MFHIGNKMFGKSNKCNFCFTRIILHFEYMREKLSSILSNSHHIGFVNQEVWQGAHTILILKRMKDTGALAQCWKGRYFNHQDEEYD